MRRARRVLGLALLATTAGLASGAERARAITIDALGDSITRGTTRSGGTRKEDPQAQTDPGGGYPARLARLLGDGTVVRSRGAGGTGIGFWLDKPGAEPKVLEQFLLALWPELQPSRRPQVGENVLSFVLESDRPDVVLLLAGVNELTKRPPNAVGIEGIDTDRIAARVHEMALAARAKVPQVLVGTLIANRRDPADATARVNRRLCELEPECVRIDSAFEAAGGLALLGDEVHPDERGHAVIAAAFAEALRARRLVPLRSQAESSPATSATPPLP